MFLETAATRVLGAIRLDLPYGIAASILGMATIRGWVVGLDPHEVIKQATHWVGFSVDKQADAVASWLTDPRRRGTISEASLFGLASALFFVGVAATAGCRSTPRAASTFFVMLWLHVETHPTGQTESYILIVVAAAVWVLVKSAWGDGDAPREAFAYLFLALLGAAVVPFFWAMQTRS